MECFQFLVKKVVNHGLEPSLSVNIETAKKNRTVLHDALLDSLAAFMTPITEADSFRCGLSEQGECPTWIQGRCCYLSPFFYLLLTIGTEYFRPSSP
jgi:hypothetical protein